MEDRVLQEKQRALKEKEELEKAYKQKEKEEHGKLRAI